ncbi:MAG: serine protease [Deltaproteobacteria bacterium]|nr:serine protease [Deltaproteobacteria bacterium]
MTRLLALPATAAALVLLSCLPLHAFDTCPDTAVVRIVAIRGVEARALGGDNRVVPLIMPAMGWGTGLVISSDGVILTAKHVIQGAQAIAVFVPGSAEPMPAKLIYQGPTEDTADDFAFIKVPEAFDVTTQVIDLPRGALEVTVGEPIEARGHPGGEAAQTRLGQVKQPLNEEGALELNTDLEPGFSGGPICREAGLLGIGVQTDGCGLGIAVPIQRIAAALNDEVEAKALIEQVTARMRGDRWRSESLFSKTMALHAVELAGWSLAILGQAPSEQEQILAIGATLEQAADLPEVQLIYAMIYWNWAMLGALAGDCALTDVACWDTGSRDNLVTALELLDGAIAREPELLQSGGDMLKAILRTCDEKTTFCSGR